MHAALRHSNLTCNLRPCKQCTSARRSSGLVRQKSEMRGCCYFFFLSEEQQPFFLVSAFGASAFGAALGAGFFLSAMLPPQKWVLGCNTRGGTLPTHRVNNYINAQIQFVKRIFSGIEIRDYHSLQIEQGQIFLIGVTGNKA